MTAIGILAYGSLIGDPGVEIGPLIDRRIDTLTPFPVEYARLSRTRGGAPTVVPHSSGKQVKAVLLVLKETVALADAKDLLWRRETRKEGSQRKYAEPTGPNSVWVLDKPGLGGLQHALYTDFKDGGKIPAPDPECLARAAIGSVARADPGCDGISYLIQLMSDGVETSLTPQYRAEILRLTGAPNLEAALAGRQGADRRVRP